MIAEPVPHNSSDWENYILMMTKHKTLEKLEELTKEDKLNDEDTEVCKNCLKSLYYLCNLLK